MSSHLSLNETPTGQNAGAIMRLALVFLVMVILQATVAGRLWFFGGQPDFLLVLAIVAAIRTDSDTGCGIGFIAGLLSASLVGEAVGTFLVTRTVAGFVAGWFTRRMFRANAGVILLATLCATVVSEVLFVVAAPRIGFLRWANGAGITLVWNVLLCLPVSLILRGIGWGRSDR